MSKYSTFLTIIIFLDLLFIITGQLIVGGAGISSPGSLVVATLLDLQNAESGSFFRELIGNIGSLFNSASGLAALTATALIGVGFVFSSTDTIKFIPIALSLALIGGDLTAIAIYLAQFNYVLGIFVMGPIVIIFYFTTLEWLRGKDN